MKEKLKRYNPFGGEVDLTTGNLFEKMILFTIPILLLSLFQLLYSSMDQVVVTNFGGGTESFDAIGSNSSLINLLIGLFVGVSVGANVVVARAKGEKKPEVAHKAIESAMLLSVFFGVAVGVIGYFMHHVDLAKKYSTRILGVRAGQIVFDGKPEEVTDEVCKTIYGRSLNSNEKLGVLDDAPDVLPDEKPNANGEQH